MKTLKYLPAGLIVLALLVTSADTVISRNNKTGKNPAEERHTLKEPDQEPNDWMAMQRAFPYGKIKPESYLAAVRQAKSMMEAAGNRANPWTFAGPDNIGGRITDIESPASDPNTIYVGASTGGVFKTTDFGAHWVNLFDDVPVISVGDIAIDPNNPQVLYCGTGEANSSSFSFLGNGIYKSTDAGESWQHTGLEHSAYIGRVIVDYANSQNIFAAACGNLFTTSDERGVYRSQDGGATWDRVLFLTDSTSAIDLVQHPANPQILFASMWERSRGLVYRLSFGESSGLWKTTDGGTTWSEVTGGLPTGSEVGRIGVTIAKSNPDIMYTFYDLPNGQVGVYRSVDGGDTWTQTNDGALTGMNSNFGWYFGQIRVDPDDPNRLFVMGVPLFRSTDGGNSWMDDWSLHVDHHAMYFDETNGRILEGNDGGLYYSVNHGISWNKINNLPFTQFYAIECDYQMPERIIGGTQDNNTVRTITGGTSDWDPILGGDGMYTLIDYSNSNIVYAEYQYGNLHRSTNGGYTMDYIAGPMSADRVNWSAPLAMDPEVPATLYFGTYRVWKSTDRGSNWIPISDDLTHGIDHYFYTLTTIAVSKLDPQVVLAGTGDGKVQISKNGGLTWEDISAGLPERWITRVATDPFDNQTIYTTLSGFRWDEPLPHVFKSTDLGHTWTDISGNLPELPVNDIVLDPDLPGKIIVATDAGLYGTTDGGASWSWIFNGLPAVPVYTMKIHEPTRTIIAGTYGLSSYKASLDEIFTGIAKPGTKELLDIRVSPNPVIDHSNLSFYLPAGEQMSFALYSIDGKERASTTRHLEKGAQSIGLESLLDGSPPAPGTYILTLQGTRYKGSVKMIVL
jgi:photosystem II stability/assembly factor-like uncharacterized protein